MLIQLTSDDVSRNWDYLYEIIERGLDNVAELDRSATMLTSIMVGAFQVWIASDDSLSKPIGVITTTIMIDTINRQRNLLLYSLTGLAGISITNYKGDLEQLREYAKAQNCVQIVGYTNNKRLIQIARELGADTSTVAISLEVSNG